MSGKRDGQETTATVFVLTDNSLSFLVNHSYRVHFIFSVSPSFVNSPPFCSTSRDKTVSVPAVHILPPCSDHPRHWKHWSQRHVPRLRLFIFRLVGRCFRSPLVKSGGPLERRPLESFLERRLCLLLLCPCSSADAQIAQDTCHRLEWPVRMP